MQKSNNKYYSNLKKYFLLIIIFITIVPVFIVSWSSKHIYQKSSLKNTSEAYERMLNNRKQDIAVFLDNQREFLVKLMGLYSFDELRNQAKLEKIFATVTSEGNIIDMGVINAEGRHEAYVGPYREILMGKEYRNEQWFGEVMLKGKYISDVFTGYRDIPHLVVAVADPQKKWILRATVNPAFFNRLLESVWIGETGDGFIVNRDGKLQTPSRFGDRYLSEEEKKLLVYHEGTTITTIGEYMYVTSWLKNREWLFIFKEKTGSILAIFYHARNQDFFIIAFASVIVVTVATFLVNHIVNRLERADYEKATIDSQMLQVEKMATLGIMAAGVAHEVNNPLQLIMDQTGWLGELLDEENPDQVKNLDEYRKSVNKIKSHVARASDVTRRLLGFSRKMEAEKAMVNINHLIEEVISFYENEANHKNIVISKQLQDDIPTIMTDGNQIQQVFLNILNNSMDAIEKNGAINIASRLEGPAIILTFEDTGSGINSEIVEKLFDPFFTTKAPGKGTGLGLSICYTIIQSLGGTIGIRNRKEGGAVVTIKLPVVKQVNLLK